MDKFRRPLLRLDGNRESRRIGRHFRISAAASEPFERHIDRIDVIALNEGPVAGSTVAPRLVVDAERKVGELSVVSSLASSRSSKTP